MSQEASGLKKEREKVLKRAFLVASGTLGSRILGLFRDIAMAALFSRAITDAWAVAFRIPNIFRRLFGEGAISASLIPTYFSLSHGPEFPQNQKEFLNSSLTYLFITLSVLTAGLWLLMEPTLQLLLSDTYWNDPEKRAATLLFARIMVGFIFFFGQYACFVSILNMMGRFALPAAAAGLLNISMLIFTFMPSHWFSRAGEQLAWGVLVGGLLQSAMVYGGLRKAGFKGRVRLQGARQAFTVQRDVLLNAFNGGVLQFATLINLYFASQFTEGSISAFYWGDRLLEFPLALASLSWGSALLPSLSEAYQQRRFRVFSGHFNDAFLAVCLLIVPSGVGLFLISEDLVRVLFYRGAFSAQDLQLTSGVVQIYALCLIPLALARLGVTALQARQKSAQASLAGVGTLVLMAGGAVLLTPSLGLKGLLYSNLVGYGVHFIWVYALLLKSDATFFQGCDWRGLLKILLLSLLMGVVVMLMQACLGDLPDSLKLVLTLGGAAGVYALGCFWGGLHRRI